jgi:hypothetical protein
MAFDVTSGRRGLQFQGSRVTFTSLMLRLLTDSVPVPHHVISYNPQETLLQERRREYYEHIRITHVTISLYTESYMFSSHLNPSSLKLHFFDAFTYPRKKKCGLCCLTRQIQIMEINVTKSYAFSFQVLDSKAF